MINQTQHGRSYMYLYLYPCNSPSIIPNYPPPPPLLKFIPLIPGSSSQFESNWNSKLKDKNLMLDNSVQGKNRSEKEITADNALYSSLSFSFSASLLKCSFQSHSSTYISFELFATVITTLRFETISLIGPIYYIHQMSRFTEGATFFLSSLFHALIAILCIAFAHSNFSAILLQRQRR